jgi:branched-chain amino acid transport system ATP-binding protein
MLIIEHLNASYDKLQILQDINLSIPLGQRVGIFGHNGAGKTSLLKCCVGELTPISGSIRWMDEPVNSGRVELNVRRGVGFVPQGHNVFKDLSVRQNLNIAGLANDGALLAEVFQLFPILKDRQDQRAESLSGGQQQMLALGMSLMGQPKLLLLDEPTTGLAPIIVKDMLNAISKISQSKNMSVLIVEQNVQSTLEHVDRAIVLKQGRIIFDDDSKRLRDQKSLWHLF